MSGICGIVVHDGATPYKEALRPIMSTMSSRGPDGSAFRSSGAAAFAIQRNYVHPEDRLAPSPLRDPESGCMIVASLRLDNREDLATALGLSTDHLQTLSDSALVLAAYHRWGDALPGRLKGDFSYAIWDPAAKQLELAVDHFGIRPLFYVELEKAILFATSLRALVASPLLERRLNQRRLLDFTARHDDIDPFMTYFDGVHRVVAAHVIRVTESGVRRRRYWAPGSRKRLVLKDDSAYEECYRQLYDQAVRRRLRGLDRAGLMLSNGIDSNSISAFAVPALRERGGRLVTATVLMRQNETGELAKFVHSLPEVYEGIDAHAVSYDLERELEAMHGEFFYFGSPVTTPAPAFAAACKTLAKNGARIAMSGMGGDQIFAPMGSGYLVSLALDFKLLTLLKELGPYARSQGRSRRNILLNELILPLLSPTMRAVFQRLRSRPGYDMLALDYIRSEIREQNGYVTGRDAPRNAMLSTGMQQLEVASLNRLGVSMTMPVLDVAASRHGMVATAPCLDIDLVEFCLSLPLEQKVKNGLPRALVRRALRGLVPDDVLSRPIPTIPFDISQARNLEFIRKRSLEMLGRLSGNDHLDSLFDLERARERLAHPDPMVAVSAGRAIRAAAFMAWAEGSNR